MKERTMGNPTPNAEQLEADDKQYVMRPWTHPKGEPVIVAKAKGCVITDVHGKDYLDFTAGYFVNAAGHCHPRIAEAASKQLHEVLQVSGKHGSIPVVQLAKKLKQLAPKSVDKSFFSTGGSRQAAAKRTSSRSRPRGSTRRRPTSRICRTATTACRSARSK
jgi:adenosylmethionine-8-amino-7-oxononanoate aminotransferase